MATIKKMNGWFYHLHGEVLDFFFDGETCQIKLKLSKDNLFEAKESLEHNDLVLMSCGIETEDNPEVSYFHSPDLEQWLRFKISGSKIKEITTIKNLP